MNDLIICAVKNRSWRDLDCFANSLFYSGYSGSRVIFVEDVPLDAQNNLRDRGFEVIPFKTPDDNKLHFQTYRFTPISSYLLANWHRFRYVLVVDVCDLVFQTNPIAWLEQNSKKNFVLESRLIGAKEGRLIKNESINKVWIERLNLGDETQYLLDQEIFCSGTIVGESSVVLHLLTVMQTKFGLNDMQGIDQGVYNWACRQSPFKDIISIPEMGEGFISTCGSFLSAGDGNHPGVWTVDPPYFDRETGLVMTPDKAKPYCIAHQYNRSFGLYDKDGAWRSILERRYR